MYDADGLDTSKNEERRWEEDAGAQLAGKYWCAAGRKITVCRCVTCTGAQQLHNSHTLQGMQAWTCTECSQVLPDFSLYLRHKEKHNRSCEVCKLQFSRPAGLSKHKKSEAHAIAAALLERTNHSVHREQAGITETIGKHEKPGNQMPFFF